MKIKKKLIEVALPLDAINKASTREKSIRHGHPSTLHLWWARRPLATARAVIFAQMVDDPSGYVDVLLSDKKKRRAAERELKKRVAGHAAKRALARDDAIAESEPTLEEVIAEQERDRLFAIIEALVLWENTTNEEVLEPARREIRQSWRRACAENAAHPRAAEIFDRHKLPAFHDPFAGGGALPLEAQRLGLEAHASDLNPVAVLINKAMIEIPPKFAGQAPVNPSALQEKSLIESRMDGGAGFSRRRPLLRPMDARGSREAHRAPVSEGRDHREDGRGAARLGTLQGPQADGDCVAVGADGEKPQPGVCRCRGAAGVHLHAVDEEGQRSVRRAGDRGTWVPVHGEGGKPGDAVAKAKDAPTIAGRELPMPDVGDAVSTGPLHQG